MLRGRLSVRLLIVGEFWEDKGHYLQQAQGLGIADRLTMVDEYVPDEELHKYFRACDACVLPYVTATQSGIVLMAYSFGKPVITTRVGGLGEVVEHGKTGLLVEPENAEALADAICELYEGDTLETLSEGVLEVRERFSWPGLVATIEHAAGIEQAQEGRSRRATRATTGSESE